MPALAALKHVLALVSRIDDDALPPLQPFSKRDPPPQDVSKRRDNKSRDSIYNPLASLLAYLAGGEGAVSCMLMFYLGKNEHRTTQPRPHIVPIRNYVPGRMRVGKNLRFKKH